jgi:hypothetical protein
MIQRCYNTKRKAYPDYGGRGIIVCDSWRNDFISFKEWAEQHGYSDELSIERINADGNYDPGNCEWITRARQARNKRTTKLDSVSISALYKRMEEAKKTREHERMNEAREELLRRGISERRTI